MAKPIPGEPADDQVARRVADLIAQLVREHASTMEATGGDEVLSQAALMRTARTMTAEEAQYVAVALVNFFVVSGGPLDGML